MEEERLYLLPQGTILKNKYRIEQPLGEGGFGITYRGVEIKLSMRVAIKEYYPYGYAMRDVTISNHVFSKPDVRSQRVFDSNIKQFLEEARKLAKCQHISSVVGVREYFEENQTAYIVMEYLDGITLKNYLQENGAMDTAWLCRLMLPLIRDVDRIHQLSFLHRDISPDNIMLINGKLLKLMDFGAARYYEIDEQRSMTVLLKHGFAPYEQYTRRSHQGPWSDVYGICATMYACITNIVPDTATDRMAMDELKPPSELKTGIPSGIEQVIMKGLSVRYESRYQSVTEMADDLEAAIKSGLLQDNKNTDGKTVIIEESEEKRDHSSEKEIEAERSQRSGTGNTVLDLQAENADRKVKNTEENKKKEQSDNLHKANEVRKKVRIGKRSLGKRLYVLYGGITLICFMLAVFLWTQNRSIHSETDAISSSASDGMENEPDENHLRFRQEAVFTATPIAEPTATPTAEPTATPTAEPTATPTAEPTATPTAEPTATPTAEPTATPTAEPTATPTAEPTATPTAEPTATPTAEPTATPTAEPTSTPTAKPTVTPTAEPTATPTAESTAAPITITSEEAVVYEEDPTQYKVRSIDKVSCSIEKYRGNAQYIRIPAEIDGKKVVSIRYNAFSSCKSLIGVEIPETVTKIDDSAFYNCRNLKSISIPDSVTKIGMAAFCFCNNLTEIDIPQSVTRIENTTFSYCSSLTSVIIPEGVTYIGECAFNACTNLERVEIPSSVTGISYRAFEECTQLKEIIGVPDSEAEKHAQKLKIDFVDKTKTTSIAD